MDAVVRPVGTPANSPGRKPGVSRWKQTIGGAPAGAIERFANGGAMSHTYSCLLVHAVFSTKERRLTIHESFRQRLYEYMGGIARHEFGRSLVVGGTADHVHGLLSIRPAVSVAEAMRQWKSLSSKWVHDTFPQRGDFAWQEGYGAFSVSPSNADAVERYIRGQEAHHKRMTFQEEFVALLKRHGIEYDPATVWD